MEKLLIIKGIEKYEDNLELFELVAPNIKSLVCFVGNITPIWKEFDYKHTHDRFMSSGGRLYDKELCYGKLSEYEYVIVGFPDTWDFDTNYIHNLEELVGEVSTLYNIKWKKR